MERSISLIVRRTCILLLIPALIVLNGCSTGSDISLLDPYSAHLDNVLKAEDDIYKIKPVSEDICVIDPSYEYPQEDIAVNACGLFDISKKQTIYCKNPFERYKIASITKIMTALLALENTDINDIVTLSSNICINNPSASLSGFQVNDKISILNLINAALINSGNDAAIALSEAVSGSEQSFVSLMNAKAKSLYADNTSFVNSNGLDESGEYSTVYDIYLIFNECISNKIFRKIVGKSSFLCTYQSADGSEVQKTLFSTNQYFNGSYSPPEGITILGGKTGHTNEAGYCLVILLTDSSGNEYIAVILGAETRDILYSQMNALLDKIN